MTDGDDDGDGDDDDDDEDGRRAVSGCNGWPGVLACVDEGEQEWSNIQLQNDSSLFQYDRPCWLRLWRECMVQYGVGR